MTETHDHDALFKRAFRKPIHATGMFKAILPTELVSLIDWSTLTLVPGSFVDEELRHRHTDLLFSAELSGKEILLYLLAEHQSTVPPLMAYRILHYADRVLQEWLRARPNATQLPAVVSMVLYQGAQEWTAPTELLELFDPDLQALVPEYLPKLQFFLDDLSRLGEEEIEHRRQLSAMA